MLCSMEPARWLQHCISVLPPTPAVGIEGELTQSSGSRVFFLIGDEQQEGSKFNGKRKGFLFYTLCFKS